MMPASVTRRLNSEPLITAEREFEKQKVSPFRRTVKGEFVTCKVGGMLLLKMVGFIEDQRAEVLEVSDHHIVMQLGRPWYHRWWHGGERRRPVRVRLDFADPSVDLPTWKQARARRSVVNVDIRPMSLSFGTRDFHRRAQSVLRNLRLHFVAD